MSVILIAYSFNESRVYNAILNVDLVAQRKRLDCSKYNNIKWFLI